MEISDELKRNLIADVENICNVTLDEETKESLMRCFEITIGTHEPKFAIPDVGHCACSEKDKHGETSVMCCNECGKPTEKFWRCG